MGCVPGAGPSRPLGVQPDGLGLLPSACVPILGVTRVCPPPTLPAVTLTLWAGSCRALSLIKVCCLLFGFNLFWSARSRFSVFFCSSPLLTVSCSIPFANAVFPVFHSVLLFLLSSFSPSYFQACLKNLSPCCYRSFVFPLFSLGSLM